MALRLRHCPSLVITGASAKLSEQGKSDHWGATQGTCSSSVYWLLKRAARLSHMLYAVTLCLPIGPKRVEPSDCGLKPQELWTEQISVFRLSCLSQRLCHCDGKLMVTNTCRTYNCSKERSFLPGPLLVFTTQKLLPWIISSLGSWFFYY